MRKWLITGALLLTATPALANWATTTWGMTPEQVVAAVPGAKALKASDDTTLYGMDNLAEAPFREGKVKLTAGFYFDHKSRKLALVDIVADDNTQCPEFRKALEARLGKGDTKRTQETYGGRNVNQISVDWDDATTGDHMTFLAVTVTPDDSVYGICKLMHQGPE